MELVAVCTNGKELLTETIKTWDPDVVLTDIRMPPSGAEEGVRIARSLRDTHPDIGVVVLSQYAEPAYALEPARAGNGRPRVSAQGENSHPPQLLDAINAVASGGSRIDPIIVEALIEGAGARVPLAAQPSSRRASASCWREIARGRATRRSPSRSCRPSEPSKSTSTRFSRSWTFSETEDVSRRRVKATLMSSPTRPRPSRLERAASRAAGRWCVHLARTGGAATLPGRAPRHSQASTVRIGARVPAGGEPYVGLEREAERCSCESKLSPITKEEP